MGVFVRLNCGQFHHHGRSAAGKFTLLAAVVLQRGVDISPIPIPSAAFVGLAGLFAGAVSACVNL